MSTEKGITFEKLKIAQKQLMGAEHLIGKKTAEELVKNRKCLKKAYATGKTVKERLTELLTQFSEQVDKFQLVHLIETGYQLTETNMGQFIRPDLKAELQKISHKLHTTLFPTFDENGWEKIHKEFESNPSAIAERYEKLACYKPDPGEPSHSELKKQPLEWFSPKATAHSSKSIFQRFLQWLLKLFGKKRKTTSKAQPPEYVPVNFQEKLKKLKDAFETEDERLHSVDLDSGSEPVFPESQAANQASFDSEGAFSALTTQQTNSKGKSSVHKSQSEHTLQSKQYDAFEKAKQYHREGKYQWAVSSYLEVLPKELSALKKNYAHCPIYQTTVGELNEIFQENPKFINYALPQSKFREIFKAYGDDSVKSKIDSYKAKPVTDKAKIENKKIKTTSSLCWTKVPTSDFTNKENSNPVPNLRHFKRRRKSATNEHSFDSPEITEKSTDVKNPLGEITHRLTNGS